MNVTRSPFRKAAALVGTIAVGLSVATVAPAQAQGSFADGTTYQRGADIKVPWIIGTTLRDGNQRVRLDRGARPFAVERARTGWVVADTIKGQRNARVLHVTPDGGKDLLARTAGDVEISPSGAVVATALGRNRSVVKVTNVETGNQVARRGFRYSRVLGVDGRRVVLQITGKRTRVASWNYRTNQMSFVKRGFSNKADLSADRLVINGSTPCDDTVVKLSDPSQVVARMKNLRVLAWNDTGRMSGCS